MTIEKQQLAFGSELRRLREQAGYTGKLFAQLIGWLPSKVSRLENGKTVPSDSDVIVWLDAVGASDAVAEQMRDQLRDLRLARSSWKRRLRTGHTPVQREYAARAAQASRLVSVEFYIVPGLVQTADYARAVFLSGAAEAGTPSDTDTAVQLRMQRQSVLYDSTKTVKILIAESALHYTPGSTATLLGQIDRLISMTGLPNVQIGIIPLGMRLPVISMHGYMILDDEVTVEVNHTELTVTDPEDVALYERITDELWSVAVEGDEARELLFKLATERG